MLLLAARALHALEAREARHAVHGVHHVVAGLQLEERLDRAHLVVRVHLGRAASAEQTREFAVVDEQRAQAGEAEAARERAEARLDARARRLGDRGERLGQQAAEAVLLGRGLAQDQRARAVLGRLEQRRGRLAHADRERLHRTRVEIEHARGQALQVERATTFALRGKLQERARVRRRLDAQAGLALLDAQRFDAHEDARAREQRGQQHAVSVLDPARVRRQAHARFVQALDAALVERIEGAQRLDLVAQELDAQRQLGREGIKVEDLAAQADLAGLFRQRRAREAGLHEAREQFARVDALATREHQELALEVGRGRHRLQQRQRRGDDHARPALGRAELALHELETFAHLVGIGARGAAGERLARREERRVEAEELEVVAERSGLGVGRGADEPRSGRVAREEGEHAGLRRAPQVAEREGARGVEALDHAHEFGRGVELLGPEGRLRLRGRCAHAPALSRSTSSASCAAQLSASLRVRPQPEGKRSPCSSACTRKARACASPRLSSRW